MLKVSNATMRFGGIVAVNDADLEINYGEIIGLIGPNGAGKTTLFNMITAVYEPTEGKIEYTPVNDTNKEAKAGTTVLLNGLRPDEIANLGICRTFQNIRLFKNLSVFDNVLIATHLKLKSGWLGSTFRFPKYRKEMKENRKTTEELLKSVDLWDLRYHIASSLPYGKQRRLEIARALATDPQLLLLDEPAAGMNPKESAELMSFIRKIRDGHNLTILVIEHHMDLIMGISDRIYVLDHGEMIAKGKPSEIQSNKRVIDAYLGVD